ncbi:nitroreductase family protein [Paenibacillus endoradicis]|uniref:nitroreductase family protein n=1 Tax=Paenibacillus endoradicis TaxID=2972487 RepID=UPI00215936B6|nr:nitroreductase family protein [Paenibacillus endoradicis]MCR8658997.1 nitroreductase family protein [Paenibacillus endoradicis]
MSTTSRLEQDQTVIQYREEVLEHRDAAKPIHPIILNRWSSRSYANESITDEQLYTVLEAARWAPSASNAQPWRFYIAKTQEEKALFQQFINPRNRLWSHKAAVFILVTSAKFNNEGNPQSSHAFDAGAAWATLAFQASALGLNTRAIGGYDREVARRLLTIPDDIELHAVITLGVRGTIEELDENFHEAEKPSPRKALEESIMPITIPGQYATENKE